MRYLLCFLLAGCLDFGALTSEYGRDAGDVEQRDQAVPVDQLLEELDQAHAVDQLEQRDQAVPPVDQAQPVVDLVQLVCFPTIPPPFCTTACFGKGCHCAHVRDLGPMWRCTL